MTSKTALVLATTAAIALGGFEMRPAAAAPEGGPAIAKQNAGADDFSSQRKRRRGRGVHPGVPLAAFGAMVGVIGAAAAAQRRYDAYEGQYYYGEPQYYAEPQYVAPPNYYYAQPQPYVRHHYAQPHAGYRHAPGPRLHPDPFQRGPLQGQRGHMPAPAPNGGVPPASGDGRM